MYDHIIPPFTRSLKAMQAILAKAEAHCAAKKIDPAVMTSARIAPDMLPFTRQIMIATDNAKGAAARLAGVDVTPFEDTETTFAELTARLQKTIDLLATFKPEQYKDAAARTIIIKTRAADLTFPGAVYLSSYAVPNIYFHLTTAYDILRHNGVEIGKADFLGA
ncbi:hypothetical protein GALL_489010 [mine drainage metagenome]|uniref:DUF1993 domain-containing protein n=1 Tax=mine drainage metagenome TaxID=410659 RepID=A0A1J5PE41_9ZZZZ